MYSDISNLGDKNPLISFIKESHGKADKKSKEHEALRNTEEYQFELAFLRRTIHDLIQTLRLCSFAASRWKEFSDNYLLPRHFDDIVEAAIAAQLAIENGALNPARRELRYMLEVSVNISFVDEVRAKDSFDERVSFYRGKRVNKSNVDHISKLPLRLLGDHKGLFAESVKSAWVRSSNYVHLTKKSMDEKLRLREQGIVLGMETTEMLKSIVSEMHEVCTCVVLLAFETIGPSFTGDLLVESLDEVDTWAFHASEFMAIVDSYFDYKSERKDKLEQIVKKRNERVKFRSNPISA